MQPADLINNAKRAKAFIAAAGEGSLSDELLVRAAVAFNMLVRQGVIIGDLDDLDLPHAIATIAAGFADVDPDPPSTPERAALFATDLDAPPVPPTGTTILALRDEEFREVSCWRLPDAPGLVVTASLDDSGSYEVTHEQTGYRTGGGRMDWEEACERACRLATIGDWSTVKDATLPEGWSERIRAVGLARRPGVGA